MDKIYFEFCNFTRLLYIDKFNMDFWSKTSFIHLYRKGIYHNMVAYGAV